MPCSSRLIETREGPNVSTPLPGKVPTPLSVGIAKAAVRLLGGSDLADAVADLTGLRRVRIETLAERAAAALQPHAAVEFREVSDTDRQWAEGVVLRSYQHLARDPRQSLVTEIVVGGAEEVSRLALKSMPAGDARAVEQASDDVRSYLYQLSTTVALLVRNWYETDTESNRIATTRTLGEAARGVRDLPEKVSREVQQYVDEALLPQLNEILEHQRTLATRSVSHEPALLSVETVRARRRDANALLNDLGQNAGRTDEATAIEAALARSSDWPLVVLVSGRGGMGKSRLLVEILSRYCDANPGHAVRWLAPGRPLDSRVLEELPGGPAIVVVDDAHRVARQLRPMLEYAKHQPEVQLILATRGSGITSIRSELLEADLTEHQVEEVAVKDLSSAEGRALVDSLLDDLNPSTEFRVFLADQARRSPFLAVLTVSLLRAGKLTGPLALDASLRKQVMMRYRDVVTDGIASESQPEVRRMLAVVAALGVVDITDDAFRSHLEEISGMSRTALLRVVQQLHDHDVLMGPTNATQFAVEMLGDQILEAEAVISGVDSGFVHSLWDTFKHSHRNTVLSGIGSLAWRLGEVGPSIVNDIWAELEIETTQMDVDDLRTLIGSLREVTHTQSAEVVRLSQSILGRLRALQSEAPGGSEEQLERSFYWLRPSTPADVERALAPVLADAASHDESTLEDALDLLWTLSQRDDRPLPQTPDHPTRLVKDRLANIGSLTDPSYPERVARRVQVFVREAAAQEQPSSPLGILEALLEKSGMTTERGERRTVQFKPFFVTPEWARPVRDVARTILRAAAADDSPFAAESLKLLGSALNPPAELFGAVASEQTIRGWDDDDLATLGVLADIASGTARSSIRRLVRQEAEWTAQYSTSARVRHAALMLITDLDNRSEDDLTEFLRYPGVDVGLPTRRGITLPTLDEITIAMQSEADAERSDDFDERYAAAVAAQQAARAAAVEDLWPGEDIAAGIHRLDAVARDLQSVEVIVAEQLHTLFSEVVSIRPELIPSIFDTVRDLGPGPLDDALPQLSEGLRIVDESALRAVINDYESADTRMREALGRAAASYGWLGYGSAYADLIERGRVDADLAVRKWSLSTVRLDENPEGSCNTLLQGQADRATIERVIWSTMRQADPQWSARLDDAEVQAILALSSAVGGSNAANALIAKIAADRPSLILTHLAAQDPLERGASRIRGSRVQKALDKSPLEVADWILRTSTEPDPHRVIRRVQPPLPPVLTSELADILALKATEATAETVVGLALALTGLNGWVPFAPALARTLLIHEPLSASQRELVHLSLRAQLTPGHWSGSGGQSEQLSSAAHAAGAAAQLESNAQLRELLELAVAELEAMVTDFRVQDEQDDW